MPHSKSLTVDEINRIVKQHLDSALSELRGAVNGEVGTDWISSHDLFEALRAAFDDGEIEKLVSHAKELWASPNDKTKRLDNSIKLTNTAREVLGRLAVRLLFESLVSSSQDAPKKERIKNSRGELAKVLTALVQPFQEQIVKEPNSLKSAQAVALLLLKPALDEQSTRFDELKAQLQQTRDAFTKTEESVEKLVKAPQAILDLLERGDLRSRYESNFPVEKGLIADYLAKNVFHECVRCFLQASTTIVHLVDLLRTTGLKNESLVHTNSTVFAYLMLGRNPEFQIYTVCGKTHDAMCGGWLFDIDDADAQAHLRSLFNRDKDQLKFAIVTPQFLTADGRMWFARPQTTLLVRVLLEVAGRVIVTSPAQRIYQSEDSLHADPDNSQYTFFPTPPPTKETGLELVVAGELSKLPGDQSDLKDMAERLNASCRYKRRKDDPNWEKLH